MKARIDLQPETSVSSTTTQDAKDAASAAGYKNAVVYLTLFGNSTTSNSTFEILSATSAQVGAAWWASVGSQTIASTDSNKTLVFTATNLGEVIRWKLTPGSSGTITFSVVVYVTDT